ncbi:MAG: RNA polymerase sigma factor [Candidatus Sumerlaeia bacterium]
MIGDQGEFMAGMVGAGEGAAAVDRRREAGRELIERAVVDPDAMAELYRIYYDRLFNYAMRRLMRVAEAEDVTAATFLKMVANLPRYRWTGRPFSSWLFSILVNEITDCLRRRNKVRVVSIDGAQSGEANLIDFLADTGLSQSERLIQLERFKALHDAIDGLPLKYQDAVTLRYFEGLSLKEIARVTGSNVGLVKWRLYHGLRKLAARLQPTKGSER